MFRPVPLLVAALACAMAAPAARAQMPDLSKIRQPAAEGTGERSIYGTFLAGREALREGDARSGAALLVGAADAQPSETLLRERAFTAALMSGDVAGAARLAPPADAPSSLTQSLGLLTRGVEALAQGKGAEAAKALSAPVAAPNHAAALLIKPYALAANGQWAEATAVHDAEGERLVELLARAARAQLFELHGREAEAEPLFKALATDSIAASLYQVPYGEFLERRGRWADALTFYDDILRAQGGGDPALLEARQHAARRDPPPAAPTLKQGAAQALTYAAAAMGAQRQGELSLMYSHLALRLDPELEQAWVFAGDALALGKNEADARAAWSHVRPGSHYYIEARTRSAYSFQRSEDLPAGLQVLREMTAADPRNLQVQYVYADLLRAHEDYAQASSILDRLVAAGGDRDWRVLYMRAVVRDKLGRWDDAKADMNLALGVSPNEPELLNFLGYNLIDRGEDVKAGLALVERAVAKQPNSGAMQDSLGWAHYRLGDYAKAVQVLETAVLLDPADPSVNDHLGDAYWKVGRRDEAGFQWRRVLSLQPEPQLKTSAESKLKDGLKDRLSDARQAGPATSTLARQ